MNQTAAKKNRSKVSATTVLLIVLLALAAVILVISIVQNTGVVGRVKTAARTENYKLSENELKVLEYQSYNNVYTNLYYCAMYYNYGLTDYVYSNFSSYLFSDIANYSSNPQGYANAHIGNYDIEGMAYTMAETMLVYNEGADREGYKADADELAEAKKNVGYIAIDTLKSGAEENSMTLGSYIRSSIGDGVSKGDVEDVIDLYARYSLFIEDKGESLKDAVSDEDAEKYREDNKNKFYYTEYVSCTLPDEDWLTEDVRKKAAECKTLDDLKKLLIEAILDANFEDEYKEVSESIGKTEDAPKTEDGEIDTAKIKADVLASLLYRADLSEDKTDLDAIWNSTDTDAKLEGYAAVGDTLVKSIYTDVKTHIIGGSTTSGSTSTSTSTGLKESDKSSILLPAEDDADVDDITKWLFATGRQEGDVTVKGIDSTSDSKTVTTYYWVRIPEGAKINDYNDEETKVGYYIELKDDTASTSGETETDATTGEEKKTYTKDEKYDLIEAAADLDARKKVFTDILKATEKTAMTEDDLKDVGDELAEWFYSDDRKEGDYARVTVGEGDDAEEYVVLFVESNEATWLINAKYYKAQEDLTEWYDAMKVTCGYTTDYVAAETTAADTEALTSDATEADTTAAVTVTDTEPVSEEASSDSAEGEATEAEATEAA